MLGLYGNSMFNHLRNCQTIFQSSCTILQPFILSTMYGGFNFSTSFCCFQSLSRVQLFATPWSAASQTPLSSTVSQSLLKFTSTESVMLSNHLILCHPLLLLPSIFPQHPGLFQWVVCSHQMTKLLELQQQAFHCSPSSE